MRWSIEGRSYNKLDRSITELRCCIHPRGFLISERSFREMFEILHNALNKRKMVGAVRFELTTSCTRNKRATRLRYAPTKQGKVPVLGAFCNSICQFVNCFSQHGQTLEQGRFRCGERWRDFHSLSPGADRRKHKQTLLKTSLDNRMRQVVIGFFGA